MAGAPTLFWSPGTCARVSLVALEEIGEPYEAVIVDRRGGKTALDDQHPHISQTAYLEINPKGKVPSLQVGSTVVTENPAIQTYLTRRYPSVRLLPQGSLELETEVLATISWFAAGVHPNITRFRFPRMFTDDGSAQSAIRARARTLLEEAFALIERRLNEREWLFGDWSLPDVYLLWLWFRATGSGMAADPFPNCAAHALRCEARPSVATVLTLEENAYQWLDHAGRIPKDFPPYAAGRAPR